MASANTLFMPRYISDLVEYCTDAWQRFILVNDTLRIRGNNFETQTSKNAPHVLTFDFDVVMDGRKLPRPVNYLLIRIAPPNGVSIDHRKRPFIVFDPRAGHGPGIGGMKQDSEIGVALRAGHPCYFVGFLPKPEPGQTMEDVCHAEAAFIRRVIEEEPNAIAKPCLIGNCQAGWQIMLTGALYPDLPGPVILVGSPLSYWAGTRGRAPMRYLGGLLGGTWMTALSGDLGNGIFDGANLVANFESLNPANTFWTKPYNVYSKADTEQERFLEFETWWGSPVLLNASEMQWIADNLFVGNRLTEGTLTTSTGTRINLRNVKSPVVVFCSWGDEITPPPQALGWILDTYDSEDDIILSGKTIVYTIHQTIGHLGIFVSGRVAGKEHGEFASCIDMIDLLPPGLYEAVIEESDQADPRADLIEGKYLFRVEARTLDDLRKVGRNTAEDDLRFRTAAAVSEINNELYKRFVQPSVRAMAAEPVADLARSLHPHRLRFNFVSDSTPGAGILAKTAELVRQTRQPASKDNPYLALEQIMSDQVEFSWKLWGDMRDFASEQMFLFTYGNPLLQALTGTSKEGARQRLRDLAHELEQVNTREALDQAYDTGEMIDAVTRSIMYVSRAAGRRTDERVFNMLKSLSAIAPEQLRVGFGRVKSAIRTQYMLLEQDETRAIRSLPRLLQAHPNELDDALNMISKLYSSRERNSDEARRFAEVVSIFESAQESGAAPRRVKAAGE